MPARPKQNRKPVPQQMQSLHLLEARTQALDSGDLSDLLAMADRAAEAQRDGSALVHASALCHEFCPRSHALHFLHPTALHTSQSASSADRVLWHIGRALEHFARTRLIAMLSTSAVGMWFCGRDGCGELLKGFKPAQTATCSGCGLPLHEYKELTLHPEGSCIHGNPDLLYLDSSGLLHPVEIKSIKKDDFNALDNAQATHVHQSANYALLIARDLKRPRSKLRTMLGDSVRGAGRPHVLYIAKDYPKPGRLPYKDFAVEVPGHASAIMADTERQLSPVLLQGSKALPPRLSVCTSQGSPRATRCGACTLCFQLP